MNVEHLDLLYKAIAARLLPTMTYLNIITNKRVNTIGDISAAYLEMLLARYESHEREYLSRIKLRSERHFSTAF